MLKRDLLVLQLGAEMKALQRVVVQEGSVLTDERPESHDSGVRYSDNDLLWMSSPFEALFERPRSSFFKFSFLDGSTAKLKTFPYEKAKPREQIEIVQRRVRDGNIDTDEG